MPPFGELRFAGPVPHARWDGTRDATAPAPTAPQPPQGLTIIPEPVIDGGDAPSCLSLNVFTPDLAGGLPVLVWFHGGGYTSGTPSSPWYHGRSFNRDGIVTVSVGYRLGAEGFLHIEGAPDNRGVLDWLAALRWVQDNIASFGGDPGRVTIAGQSAGGGACCTLASLPQAEGLFTGVIAMSGSVSRGPSWDQARWVAAAVATELGVEPSAEALAEVSPASLVRAQTAGPDRAADATGDRPPRPRLLYQPFVDGEVIGTEPIDAIREGRTRHLPFLIGTTEEEFNATTRGAEISEAQLIRRLTRLGFRDDAAREYMAIHGGAPSEILGQALTDTMFRLPAVMACEARQDHHARTFHYEFRWKTAVRGMGSVHCLDLPFAWDLLEAEGVEDVTGAAPPRSLADEMHRAWVRFVETGDAGWSPYEKGHRATMLIDERWEQTTDHLADLLRLHER